MSGSENCILLQAGKFDAGMGSTKAGLDQIFARLSDKHPAHLVIHFHGGLVSSEAGLAAADGLTREYREAGAESLFFVWESGLSEILSQKVQAIFAEDLFQQIRLRVAGYVQAKLDNLLTSDGSRGMRLPVLSDEELQSELDKGQDMFDMLPIARLSPDTIPAPNEALSDGERQQIEDEIDADPVLRQEFASVAPPTATVTGARSAGLVPSKATLMDPETLADIIPTDQEEGGRFAVSSFMLGKHIVTIIGMVLWQLAKRRDHGPYLTIVEEVMRAFYVRAVGRLAWQSIKQAIQDAFIDHPEHGGAALVRELDQLYRSGARPCITLIGHSAGAIYVARLLRELQARADPAFRVNVILIAPACTFTDFARSLAQASGIVGKLCIFGMGDKLERRDAIAAALYPASLLYFVSGVLEDERDQPIVGMQRYYAAPYEGGRFEDIEFVRRHALLCRPNAVAWAHTSGVDGANCDMVSHGGWFDAPATLASVKHLISQRSGDAT